MPISVGSCFFGLGEAFPRVKIGCSISNEVIEFEAFGYIEIAKVISRTKASKLIANAKRFFIHDK